MDTIVDTVRCGRRTRPELRGMKRACQTALGSARGCCGADDVKKVKQQKTAMNACPSQIFVRHINNNSHVLQGLAKMFNSPEQSDVVIRVGYRRYHLHKLLLLRSEVLRVMLAGSQWRDAKQSEVCLEEPEECEPFVEIFFRYFYTGEVDLSIHNVVPLLVLANKYGVPDLEESCEKFASLLVFSGIEIADIAEMWQLAEQLNLRLLSRKCREFMLLNMDTVLRDPCFTELPMEQLMTLLAERDMIVTSEAMLFAAVQHWLLQEGRKENYLLNLKQILPHIKFCMMSPDHLVALNAALSPEARNLVSGRLLDAYKFHSIPFGKRSQAGLAVNDCPRLYTSPRSPSICTHVSLGQQEQALIQRGSSLGSVVNVPVSVSRADSSNTREWNMSLKSTNNVLNLEVAGKVNSEDEVGTIEPSVVIYRQVNGKTVVKGVMQFRCFVRTLNNLNPDRESGHVFNVVMPSDALDADSPYQITDNEGNTYCKFLLIMRHYHDDLMAEELSRRQKVSHGKALDLKQEKCSCTQVNPLNENNRSAS